ncbi:MAG: hypothetical protein ACRCVT_02145 [Leadbetterella sp.]
MITIQKTLLLIFLTLVCIWAQGQNVTVLPSGINNGYIRTSYETLLSISDSENGDLAFDTTYNCLRVFIDNRWICSNQDPSYPLPNIAYVAGSEGEFNNIGSSEIITDMVIDKVGGIYVIGMFINTIKIGNFTKTSSGESDVFIAKFTKEGKPLWIQTAGGSSSDSGYGIAIDSLGGIVITGNFIGTATFGSQTRTAQGSIDVFTAKISSSFGTYSWVRTYGSTNGMTAQDICIGKDDYVYVTGSFTGSVVFNNIQRISAGSADVYVIRYNSTGSFMRGMVFAGSSFDTGKRVIADTSGNVYVGGYYMGNLTIGGSSYFDTGNPSFFIAKLDSFLGTVLWSNATNLAPCLRFLNDMVLNTEETKIIFTGTFRNTCIFGGVSRASRGNADDIYVSTMLTSNGVIVDAFTISGVNNEKIDAIHIDKNANIYISGTLSDRAAEFASITYTPQGRYDKYIAKFNSFGDPRWVQGIKQNNTCWGTKFLLNNRNEIIGCSDFDRETRFGNTVIKRKLKGFSIFKLQQDE